jgi:tripartite-type tricarboxylate transporter receptor subunit TctC
MKNIIKQLVTAVVVSTVSVATSAQTFPSKPVKIVTSMNVGSAPDSVIRKVADRLKDTWKVPVVVENRPGAAGQVAMEYYLSEKPDSHNLYFNDLANFVSMPLLYNKENLVARLQPVIPIYSTYFAVIAPSNQDMTNFVDVVKRRPFYGSWAVGSVAHICGAELNETLNLGAVHVPYKENSAWFSDLSNNNLSYSCSSIGSVQSFLKGDRIKLVAIGSPRRLTDFPNLPTVRERFGINLSVPESWLAVFINKDVDSNTISKINKDIEMVVKSKEIQDHIAFVYGNSIDTDLQKFNARWKKDVEIHKNIIKKYNITIK